MKIAVAAMGNTVAAHFGHCENFIFFDTENGVVIDEKSVPNPGHRPGFLPNFLADNGANVIIAGGMGGGAVDIFNERNVEVVVGAEGDANALTLKCIYPFLDVWKIFLDLARKWDGPNFQRISATESVYPKPTKSDALNLVSRGQKLAERPTSSRNKLTKRSRIKWYCLFNIMVASLTRHGKQSVSTL